MNNNRASGFTLIEILVAVVVIGILSAAAILAYQSYANRAASVQLIEQYDALREKTIIAAGEASVDLCADPQTSLVSSDNLYSDHADLSIIKTDLGYAKPLGMHIKADVADEGKHNTAIAREAHNVLNRSNRIAPGAVITDSAVSFTALLVNTPCTGSVQIASSSAAQGVSQPAAPVSQPTQPAPAPAPAAAPAAATNTTHQVHAKPSKDDHPCKDGYVFTPDRGQTTFPMTGKCEKDSINRTDAYASVQCEKCSGPVQICEKLHHTTTCEWPSNICVNHVINSDSGARTVDRKCGDRQTAYQEWYLGSSDSDRCQTFEQGNIYTLGFECTYACTGDKCNVKLSPLHDGATKETMYRP